MSASVILEPVDQNTALAIPLAALTVANDLILFVLTADHIIQGEGAFTNAVTKVFPMAESLKISTLVIVPDAPLTVV